MEPSRSLVESVYDSIVVLHRLTLPEKETVLRELGLSRSQAEALWYLKCNGSVTVSDIAERQQIGKSAATYLLDGLVEAGLVTRQGDGEDRRVVMIELSEAGRQKIKAFSKAFFAKLKPMIERLDETELATLLSLHTKLSNKGKEA